MKARTTEQKEAERLRKLLPAPSMRQLNWMIGQEYERTHANYEEAKKKVSNYDYFSIVTSLKGWQIVRYYLAHSEMSRNGYKFHYIVEVSQRWMRADANGVSALVIFERQKTMCWQWKAQPYALDSPLALKPWSTDYTRSGRTMFFLADFEVYPIRRFAKEFVDNGMAKAIGRADEICLHEERWKLLDEIKSITLDKSQVRKLTKQCYLPAMVETLFKMGEPSLAHFMLHKDGYMQAKFTKYWVSFLIARRHGLRTDFEGWMEWLDYVQMLDDLGRDIRSPHYVAPEEGVAIAHDRLMVVMERERARKKAEEDRRMIAEHEAGYKARMQSYFGLAIVTDSGITITPLQSVQAFYDEGMAMHHCVYSCGYYAKEKSLCLSARDKDGKRIETIEIDLETMSVLQSRGLCNKPTEFHKEIVKAMEDNMWQIEDISVRKDVRMAS